MITVILDDHRRRREKNNREKKIHQSSLSLFLSCIVNNKKVLFNFSNLKKGNLRIYIYKKKFFGRTKAVIFFPSEKLSNRIYQCQKVLENMISKPFYTRKKKAKCANCLSSREVIHKLIFFFMHFLKSYYIFLKYKSKCKREKEHSLSDFHWLSSLLCTTIIFRYISFTSVGQPQLMMFCFTCLC